jgi:PAS domain S-box-containing protein
LLLMAVFTVARASLIHAGIVNGAYMLGFPFLVVFVAIAYEFGADMIRSVRLASRLQASEAALRLSERRMAQASDAARLGMWEWDRAGNEIWASAPCRAIYGFATDEPIDSDKITQRVHPDDREAWRVQLDLSLQAEGIHESVHRVVLPDGAVHWLDVRGRVEMRADRGALLRGVSLDITERRRAELELEQQRNELAHLSRVTMLGELSGSLAHELNQPLTAILSNAQAALRFIASDSGKIGEVREILQDIVSDDRRAGEIIQGLRDLLKKGETKTELLDINAAVQRVLQLTRSDLLNADITIGTQLAADLPNAVGDPVQLQQILLNLVINGCDAMSANAVDDREILVRTRLAAPGEIEVCVSDQGHGIPPDRLESVFAPFFTTKKEGLGLGLAVCRQIIAAHGGRLWAENNPGKGSSFFFTIHAHEPAAS